MRNEVQRSRRRRTVAAVAAVFSVSIVLGGAAVAAATTGSDPAGPTSTSATAAPVVPCGLAVFVKPDGSAYTCSFSDEFSGSALDARTWSAVTTAATGQRSGLECDVDTPGTLAVGGGALTITARRLDRPMSCDDPYGSFDTSYTGGMITTSGKFAQTYGRVEMRARFPQATVAGLQSSLWMYPQHRLRGAGASPGEIDIAEWFSGWGSVVVPHLHYNGDWIDPHATTYRCTVSDPSAFHTYAVEWTPMSITFVYDGRTCLRDTSWVPFGLLAPGPFDQPFNLLIGNGRGVGNNAPTADTPFPSTLQVDYVRAWS